MFVKKYNPYEERKKIKANIIPIDRRYYTYDQYPKFKSVMLEE